MEAAIKKLCKNLAVNRSREKGWQLQEDVVSKKAFVFSITIYYMKTYYYMIDLTNSLYSDGKGQV